MDMPKKFTWEEGALTLLENRDRYTRKEIREEFSAATGETTIEFDPAEHGYLTPVSNGRFSVVWYLDPNNKQGIVRAVVPLTGIRGSTDGLKEYVERVIDKEFKRANAVG